VLYAMPCGMNTIVYPKLVEKDCRLGAATVLVSTVLSLITIPLCIYLLIP
jgi:predicted permease